MKIAIALVLLSWVLAACGGDKPPMVPDPDTSATPAADAGAD